ncbi:hypothetical protein [Candidatus Riesia pediculischaeffi]|uniref:50S ribosomal protein L25 n=1 Tax=Candidatus Riesia pediculischaeffi PTSU TaxID=1401651 RepID=A0A0C1S0D1_9ENTR|nr:hypothetical protein [Candidatus Riesia pediculischaeffi]KIE64012.1 hypothetical protein P689_122181 [Candidatus Riesia pediculischaeffi PTSU]
MIFINAEIRTDKGKICNRKLKKKNEIPAILHTVHMKDYLVKIHDKEVFKLEKSLKYNNPFLMRLLSIKEEIKEIKVLIKEVQRDPCNGKIIHINFLEILN